MESLEFKYALDIHFCYNGNLGTLQQKTKDNKRLAFLSFVSQSNNERRV